MEITGVNSYSNGYASKYMTKSNYDTTQQNALKTSVSDTEKNQIDTSAKDQEKEEKRPKEVMINGLYVSVDPAGKIANDIFWKEKAKQINEITCATEAYYADAHKENLSFDNPYNHIVAKYKFPDSPYFRSDMSEEEREMSFSQETALLRKTGLLLNDPYALASTGGVRDIDQAISDAIQKELDLRRDEMLKEIGGESTYESLIQKMQVKLDAAWANGQCSPIIDKTV